MKNFFKRIINFPIFSGKTPEFWVKDGFIPQLLLPLMVIYFFLKRLSYLGKKPYRSKAKIICIGNVIAGGSGKTPCAIKIFEILQKNFPEKNICFLSKGYKGSIIEPTIVDDNFHNFKQAGDEPLLLCKYGKTIISKDRLEGIKFAENNNFDIIILDDGLHDKRIVKDKSYLVIDGKFAFGNGLLLPSGPLRDRLDYAVSPADEIIIIGKDEKKSIDQIKKVTDKKFKINKAYIDILTEVDNNEKYLAFAGLARPEKFFEMLKNEMKLNLIDSVSFADHYSYDDNDLVSLLEQAKLNGAKLITTEKDAIKINNKFLDNIIVIKIKISFEQEFNIQI
jgi:tetraacyldisaccharide 4'-kinase